MDRFFVAVLLVLLLACPAVVAQDQQPVAPQVALGRRGDMPRRVPVLPTLMIVNTPEAYAHAVSRWTPSLRFPVLIDDGTALTRQAISRFAHGFRPTRVVRWNPEQAPTLPADRAERREAINRLHAQSWQIPENDPAQLVSTWASGGWLPPGVVIADETDPAWTAALALASGRGQPIVWVQSLTSPVDHEARPDHAAMLSKAVSDWADGQKLLWDSLGDAIDAITLCLNDPARVRLGEDNTVALTDMVGRHADNRRWAWASQIFGSEAQAAYMAMSSLFIQPRTAFVFDSYPNEEPWSQWDGTEAAQLLGGAAIGGNRLFEVTLVDQPTQGLGHWRVATNRGLGGDRGALILVNTKGNSDFFELSPGRARAGDVPHLLSPSVVHFVHSWSCMFPGNRQTIGGRWFERGVFAFVGSVQEPGLGGFVPTPQFAGRMLSSAAWAASARTEQPDPWRIAVFGDALFTIGPDSPRTTEATLPLEPVVDLNDVVRRAGSERNFVALFEALQLRGDHTRIAPLIEAMVRDRPQEITPSIARATLPAVALLSTPDVAFEVFNRLDPVEARSGWARDLLWTASRRGVPPRGVTTLTAHVRDDQADADRSELASLTGSR